MKFFLFFFSVHARLVYMLNKLNLPVHFFYILLLLQFISVIGITFVTCFAECDAKVVIKSFQFLTL